MEIENIENVRELAKTELEEYFVKLKENYPITKFEILRIIKARYKMNYFWIDVKVNFFNNSDFYSISPIKELINHNFKYIKVYGLGIETGEILINFMNIEEDVK